MKKVKTIIVLVAVIFLHDLKAQESYTIDDLEKFIKVERLSERILVIRLGVTGFETVTAIATEKGIVMIDAGMCPAVTARYRKIIEKEFNRSDFKYVINTHGDMDHTFGNTAFPETKIIAHENTGKELLANWGKNSKKPVFDEYIKQWKNDLQKYEINSDKWKQSNIYLTRILLLLSVITNDFTPPLPDISFNDNLILDMGDVTFNMTYFGKAHRTSDILIYLTEEKVLFVGDLMFKSAEDAIFNNVDKDKVNKWHSVLNTILKPDNEIKYIVSGHSKVTMDKEVIMTFYNRIKTLLNNYNGGK